jgi:hypothetical protein
VRSTGQPSSPAQHLAAIAGVPRVPLVAFEHELAALDPARPFRCVLRAGKSQGLAARRTSTSEAWA